MKIVFVHHGSILGGAPKSLRYQIEGLRKARPDWELKVLCVYESMRPYFEEVEGVTTGSFPQPGLALGKYLIGLASLTNSRNRREIVNDLSHLSKLVAAQLECLRQESPDILHLNSAVLFTTAYTAKVHLGIPVVWHIRELLTGMVFSPRRLLARYLLLRYSDNLLAIGPSQAKPFQKKEKVHLVPNIAGPGDSAPNSDVRKQCREELGFRESDFVILSLGGLVWRKGPLELLLCRRHLKNPMKILIAGSAMFDGRRPCQLRLFHRCVAHLELFLVQVGVLDRLRYLYSLRTHCELESIPKGQIKLLPLTSDIQPLIAASDVVVSLHNFPHSSRSVFEAWRQRRPVVVFAKSGASDGVRHCENGIIVERKDPRCVAAALDSLFEACTLRERIANNGQLIAEKHHGEGAVIARLLKAYEKLTLSA